MRTVLHDWLLSLALVAVALVEAFGPGLPTARTGLALPLLLAAALALGLRRHRPATATGAAVVLTAGHVLVALDDLAGQPPLSAFLVLLATFFALGAHVPRRVFVPAGLVAGGTLVGLELATLLAGRPPGDVVPPLLFCGGATVVGRLLYYRGRQLDAERERAVRAEQDRDRHAREAAAAERTRIARELHDVVAHSLSVVVIQASVEARLLGDRTGSTAQTLRTIEATGRDALAELRRLLGLLRTDGDPGTALEPPASLRQLDDLLAAVRRAGVDAALEVTGEPRPLPAGVDLSAYRVAQEALTNALKHAPGAAVRVRIGYAADGVTVDVENDHAGRPGGDPAGAGLAGAGQGLVGMQERVKVYGGRLHAGPRPDGGFSVQALIPVVSEPA